MGGAQLTYRISQDTVGPLCRSVADAAVVLSIIAGRDPLDNFTLAQPATVPNYTQALNASALQGVRLGIPRALFATRDPNIIAAFNATLDNFRNLGATLVDPANLPDTAEFQASGNETIVLNTDFKVCDSLVIAFLQVC